MCIDFEGHHSDGSSFVNENDFCYYRNCLYNHRYKFSSEKEPVNESQQYIVSQPGLGSDPPIGSDRGWGRDNTPHLGPLGPHLIFLLNLFGSCKISGFLSFFVFSHLNAGKR